MPPELSHVPQQALEVRTQPLMSLSGTHYSGTALHTQFSENSDLGQRCTDAAMLDSTFMLWSLNYAEADPIARHAAVVCGHTTAQKHPHTQIGVRKYSLSASRSLGVALRVVGRMWQVLRARPNG